MRPLHTLLLLSMTSALACGGGTNADIPDGSTPTPDGGTDGQADAKPDATDDASIADAGVDAPLDAFVPPPVPVLAVDHIYFGDRDFADTASPTAWKQFGRNVDGKVTTAASTDVCTLTAGAPKSAQNDGTNGIDNSWGENVLPIFQTLVGPGFSTTANQNLHDQGYFTDVVALTGLTAAQDQSPLQGAFYAALGPGTKPKWDGTDSWKAFAPTGDGGSAPPPPLTYPAGAMQARVWSSGDGSGNMLLIVGAGLGYVATIPIRVPKITMTLSADGTHATQGILSGVIPTEEYIAILRQELGLYSQQYCSGAVFDSISQQIRQAQDILIDGTNVAGTPCNGISIGIGFTASPALLQGTDNPPVINPCP